MRLSEVCEELDEEAEDNRRKQLTRTVSAARERTLSAGNRSVKDGSSSQRLSSQLQAAAATGVSNSESVKMGWVDTEVNDIAAPEIDTVIDDPTMAPWTRAGTSPVQTNTMRDDSIGQTWAQTRQYPPPSGRSTSTSCHSRRSRPNSSESATSRRDVTHNTPQGPSRATSRGPSRPTSRGPSRPTSRPISGSSAKSAARAQSAQSYCSLQAPLKGNMSCIRVRMDEGPPLSRHCCDVLGMCHECRLAQRRVTDTLRYTPLTSTHEFAETIVLRKLLPDVPQDLLEDMVVRGGVQRLTLHERLAKRRIKSAGDVSMRGRGRVRQPEGWFNGLQQLQCKMTAGLINNHLTGFKSGSLDYWRPLTSKLNTIKQEESFSEKSSPHYISPKVVGPPKLRTTGPYEPPLLPRVCQNTQPSFFAGTNDIYQLPERLPEVVVEGQIQDMSAFNAAWTEGSNTTQTSV